MAVTADTPDIAAEDRTRSLVHQFYENSLRADIEGVAKILHPDVVNPEAESLPYGGTHVGREAVLQLLAQIYSAVDLGSVVIGDILVNSKRAAAFLEISFKSGDSADTQKMAVVETFVIRDGLIAEIKPYYFDTAALVAG